MYGKCRGNRLIQICAEHTISFNATGIRNPRGEVAPGGGLFENEQEQRRVDGVFGIEHGGHPYRLGDPSRLRHGK